MQKLLIVTGPTASGKTALSIGLAQRFGSEIVCADSRTVYRGMNVGTAKITEAEMQGIPHFGLDLVEPSERYSAWQFKEYAEQLIGEIAGRGHVPMLVGGTGLYISSVVENYDFNSEHEGGNGVGNGERKFDALMMMPRISREGLYARVNGRVDWMMANGLVEEVKGLLERFGADAPGMTGIGYRQVAAYLRGELSLEGATELLKKESRRYAKRQVTWWRHHGEVIEVDAIDDAARHVEAFLK